MSAAGPATIDEMAADLYYEQMWGLNGRAASGSEVAGGSETAKATETETP